MIFVFCSECSGNLRITTDDDDEDDKPPRKKKRHMAIMSSDNDDTGDESEDISKSKYSHPIF